MSLLTLLLSVNKSHISMYILYLIHNDMYNLINYLNYSYFI